MTRKSTHGATETKSIWRSNGCNIQSALRPRWSYHKPWRSLQQPWRWRLQPWAMWPQQPWSSLFGKWFGIHRRIPKTLEIEPSGYEIHRAINTLQAAALNNLMHPIQAHPILPYSPRSGERRLQRTTVTTTPTWSFLLPTTTTSPHLCPTLA